MWRTILTLMLLVTVVRADDLRDLTATTDPGPNSILHVLDPDLGTSRLDRKITIPNLRTEMGLSTLVAAESLWGVNVIVLTDIDTLTELEALAGAVNIIASTEIDTLAELEALQGAINIIQSTEIDTLAELETLQGGINIIQSTEIDTESEIETLSFGGGNVLKAADIDTEAEFEALLFTLPEGGSGTSVYVLGNSVSNPNFANGTNITWHADGTNIYAFPTNIVPSQIAAMTSAELAGIISDETGTSELFFVGGNLGSSTAATQSTADDSSKVATTAFVHDALAAGGAVDTNWEADGTTNSTLAGTASVNNLVATNGASIGSTSGTPFILEGATADDWETTIAVTDPTADNTITLPNASGTVALTSNPTLTSAIVTLNGTADGLTDDTYDGITITGRNAGETVAQWELVRFNSADSEFHLADADAAGEFPARGIAVAASTDGNAITVLVQGVVRNDGWAWGTVGGPIYLSDTAGGLTQTAPSTSGDAVQIVGWALSDDEAYLNFSGHWVTAP